MDFLSKLKDSTYFQGISKTEEGAGAKPATEVETKVEGDKGKAKVEASKEESSDVFKGLTEDVLSKLTPEQAQTKIDAVAKALGGKKETELSTEEKDFLSKYNEEGSSAKLPKEIEGIKGHLLIDSEKEYDSVETAIEEHNTSVLTSYKEKLPDDVKELLDFVENKKGTVQDYIEMNNAVNYASIKLDNPTNQQAMVFELLTKVQGLTPEDATKKIGKYVEKELIEDEAKEAQEKLTKWQEKQRKDKLKLIEDRQTKSEATRKEYVTKVKEVAEATNELLGVKLTKKDKTESVEYATKIVKDGLTQLEIDLTKPENRIKVAHILKKNFDIDVKSKVRKELDSELIKSLSKLNKDTLGEGKGKTEEEKKQIPTVNLKGLNRFFAKQTD